MSNENSKSDTLHPSLDGLGEVKNKKLPEYNTADSIVYKYIKDARKELMNQPTHAEIMLWKYLRNNQTGYKFRRQHVIGKYIADFVCLPKKLIIEIDGKIHLKQQEEDANRTDDLNALGFRVIRFTNEEVLQNVMNIIDEIKFKLTSPNPSKEGNRECNT